MNESNLGILITPEHRRDAIHVAILPVMAACELRPGEHISIIPCEPSGYAALNGQKVKIGIVDPFLKEPVQPGQWFYCCLYPKTVTSLRHSWTHPLIAAEGETVNLVADSEAWLRAYAIRFNSYEKDPQIAYASLIEGLRTGNLHRYGDDLCGLYDLDDVDELRDHAERVLGIRIDWNGFSFSCAC